MSARMAGTFRVSAVDDSTDRHDSLSHSQKPVWTSESNSLENLRKGDHVWCYAPGRKNAIQHHGIFDGTGVYHFDTVEVDKKGDQYKVDRYYIYNGCETCLSRLNQRQKAGLPSCGVRFNCLSCFSHGKNVYRREYEASRGGREKGSRSTRVCNRSGDEVVKEAKRLHKNDGFGNYYAATRNCEDFANYCKTGKLGSKQVTRAEHIVLGVIVAAGVGAIAAHVALKGIRKRQERELEKSRKRDEKLQKPLV